MQKHEESLEKARQYYKVADHILTQTYPLLKDTKLLLAVLENLFLALTNSMAALLYSERLKKEIPPFQDNFDSKFNLFERVIAPKYKISFEYINMIRDIKNTIRDHKKSQISFTRKEVFVICSDDYSTRTVSFNQLAKYLERTKSFINQMSLIIGKQWKK